jgi:hypothetical protein
MYRPSPPRPASARGRPPPPGPPPSPLCSGSDLRLPRLLRDADPGRCAPGCRVREHRHPRPLPRLGAARAGVLGGGSGAGEGINTSVFRRRPYSHLLSCGRQSGCGQVAPRAETGVWRAAAGRNQLTDGIDGIVVGTFEAVPAATPHFAPTPVREVPRSAAPSPSPPER